MNINNFCLNCTKNGHISKKCNDPTTSYGIISFNINKKYNIKNINDYINITDFNYHNIHNITKIQDYYDDIKILMIMRKHSLTYIEFIRGKYNLHNIHEINKLFQLMSTDENIKIKISTFENLWNDLWMITAYNKIYKKEYITAVEKFYKLKEANFYNLLDNNKLSNYSYPEWGFPKGRKNMNEDNKTCAIREFIEETSVNDTMILDKIDSIYENYTGTNNIKYRNIYYLGYNESTTHQFNINNSYEVGNIKWLSFKECLSKIRPYETNKFDLLYSVYFFIINIINYN